MSNAGPSRTRSLDEGVTHQHQELEPDGRLVPIRKRLVDRQPLTLLLPRRARPDGTMLAQEFHASTPSVPRPSSGRSEGRSRRRVSSVVAIRHGHRGGDRDRACAPRDLADADLEAMLSPDAGGWFQACARRPAQPGGGVELKTAEDFESSALSQVALKNEAFQALSVEERNLVAHR